MGQLVRMEKRSVRLDLGRGSVFGRNSLLINQKKIRAGLTSSDAPCNSGQKGQMRADEGR
jgi:hypothetical protein